METKDSAVQLLKEWRYNSKMSLDERFFSKEDIEKIYSAAASKTIELSRRLDEKAGAAGITIEAGVEYAHDSFVYVRVFQGRAMNLEFSEPYKKYGTLPAREQQAIQEWLLIKNEEKTA